MESDTTTAPRPGGCGDDVRNSVLGLDRKPLIFKPKPNAMCVAWQSRGVLSIVFWLRLLAVPLSEWDFGSAPLNFAAAAPLAKNKT